MDQEETLLDCPQEGGACNCTAPDTGAHYPSGTGRKSSLLPTQAMRKWGAVVGMAEQVWGQGLDSTPLDL